MGLNYWIGSDVKGKLLITQTGNIKGLKSGPVTVKTHLEWSLMEENSKC